MSTLDIKIHSRTMSRYISPLGKNLDDETFSLIVKAFAVYVQSIYLEMIEEAIHSNRYRQGWEPTTDEEYVKYLGTTPTKDILPTIRDALEVEKIGYNYYIRFNPRYLYPGSKLRLVQVLRALEYGTSKFHSRPIFRKIITYLNRNITRLWRGFLFAKGVL